jgi:hypothetical protein
VRVVLDDHNLQAREHEVRIDLAFRQKGVVRPGGRPILLKHFAEQLLQIGLLDSGIQEQERAMPEDLGESPPKVQVAIRHAPILLMTYDQLLAEIGIT